MDANEDSGDTGDSEYRKLHIRQVKYNTTGLHNPDVLSHPSRHELNARASKILDNVSHVNNHCGTDNEKCYDRVAVCYTANEEIYVAANVKERF
ncbi:unnamed protein product [Adineta ricciae]|uniref:Uncharacterized protein n=1 Tax=Adineta ricciae TaxID=249248 RepID=A0A815C4X5_ADIRI|nr:unnamed protein product [Adineta ricciae]CAF1282269.1 unnamed protein product [Adineta ricciae]